MKNIDQEFEDAVAWIDSVPKFTKKNSIEHVKSFIGRLEIPGDSFDVVHVAGTNGKGSVCCFLACMIRKTGKRVGLFTSPHLEDMRERIAVDGKMCTKEEFVGAYNYVRGIISKMTAEGEAHPTYFEILFAISLVVFARAGVEIAVLETGMGGRLDATNAVENPLVCVITPISLEHTEYLGDTIEKIAAEKAGIIKPGRPAVFMDMGDAAADVIKERAKELGSPALAVPGKSIRIVRSSQSHVAFYTDGMYHSTKDEAGECLSGHVWEIPSCALYEARNAALSLAAFDTIYEKLLGSAGTDEERARLMQSGLDDFFWPGRMDEILPEVYADGAHNAAGIEAFIETVKSLTGEDKEKPLLVFGMFSDKKPEELAKKLAREIDWEAVATADIKSKRNFGAAELSKCFGEKAAAYGSAEDAFRAMLRRKRSGQKLFCAGSLYLIGEIKSIADAKGNSDD